MYVITNMATKLEELSRCDSDFLLTIAKETNLSYSYYSPNNKEQIINILCNRFNYDTIQTIVDLYLLCCDAYEVADIIKPHGMDQISVKVPEYFGDGEYLYEVRIGRRICDIILLKNNNIISVEIKSGSDKISSAVEQVQNYQTWSNQTYLIYDRRHKNYIFNSPFFMENGVGLLEYSNGTLQNIRNSRINNLEKKTLLNLMTYNYLKKISKLYGIKNTNKKVEMICELNRIITNNKTQKFFKDYIRNR